MSPDLAVQLPLPDADEAAPEAVVSTAERLPARRPRTAVLEDELAAALAEVSAATRSSRSCARCTRR